MQDGSSVLIAVQADVRLDEIRYKAVAGNYRQAKLLFPASHMPFHAVCLISSCRQSHASHCTVTLATLIARSSNP